MFGQQLVYSNFNHMHFNLQVHYLPYAVNIVYLQYILHLTYTLLSSRVVAVINLYINERRAGAVTVLDLKGRLRVGGNMLALHKSIRSLLLEKKTMILLNLAGVNSIDSCGLGELVASQISVENRGGEIKLVGLTETLRELFTASRLVTVFDIYAAEAEALESFTENSTGQEKGKLAFA